MVAERVIVKEWVERHVRVVVRQDDIVEYHLAPNSHTTLEDQKAISESLCRELGTVKRYALIVDSGDFATADPEATRYGRSREEESAFIAIANISPSLAQRLVANFYFTVLKPSMPFRLFNSFEECEVWCLEMLEKHRKSVT
jgi:hypothetical protein